MPDLDLTPPPAIFKWDLGHGGWTTNDTLRELAAMGLLGVDWAQTRTIAKTPGTWNETNPLLGQHPSSGQVNNYFGAWMLAHPTLSYLLPPDWRLAFQLGTIGVEAPTVHRNWKIGIGATF